MTRDKQKKNPFNGENIYEEITEQAHFIQAITDIVPAIITVVALPSRKIIYTNRNVMVLLGFDAREIAQMSFDERVSLFHPDDLPLIQAYYERFISLDDNGENGVEYRLRKKNGDWIFLSSRGKVFKRDEQNNVVQVLMIAQEVTERKKAEREIKKAKEFLQATIDSSPDRLHVFRSVRDDDGEIIDFEWALLNRAAREKYPGHIGKTLLQMHPEAAEEGIFSSYKKVVETGITVQRETHSNHEDLDRWMQITVVKLHDGVVTTIRDITESKQAEQEMLRLKDEIAQIATNKYLTLFNNMEQGFCIIEMIFDETGKPCDYRFLEINPVFEKQTGLQQAAGKTMRQLQPAHEEHWFETYGNVVKTGEPVHFENEAAHLAGGIWYEVFAFPFGAPGNHQLAVLFNDITLRKRREQHQAFLSELSKDLVELDSTADAMRRLSEKIARHFVVKWCVFSERNNETGLYSVSGWNDKDASPINETDYLREYLSHQQTLPNNASGPTIVNDTETDPHTNAKNHAALNIRSFIITPLVRNGQRVFQLAIIDDKKRQWQEDEVEVATEITGRIWTRLERARNEEALRESRRQLKRLVKQKDEFIGIASHELKTPVTSMKAYAEIVQERLENAGNKDNSDLLSRLKAQVDRLTVLINRLLDTTRISEGQLQLTFEETDINELLNERVEEIKRTTNHQFELQTQVVPPVVVDRERIGQVITNLLSNAIKYSPNGTTITITGMAAQNGIEVSVKDEGYGIPEGDVKRIFDRFFRVTANNMDTFPGMGLGLYITAQIIQKHGGTISVQSKEGEGSIFSFVLPYSNSQPSGSIK